MGKLHSTSRWQKKRAEQLRREPLCRMCLSVARVTPATVADHTKPHRNDPALFWAGDLQSLCKTHHNSEKQRFEKSGQVGIRGCDADGLPIDPNHPWRQGANGV